MDSDENIENTRIKKIEKIAKRRSSLESGGDNVGGDSAHLRRHKSLDGGEDNSLQNNERERKEKGKKESKTSRRIRNKVKKKIISIPFFSVKIKLTKKSPNLLFFTCNFEANKSENNV